MTGLSRVQLLLSWRSPGRKNPSILLPARILDPVPTIQNMPKKRHRSKPKIVGFNNLGVALAMHSAPENTREQIYFFGLFGWLWRHDLTGAAAGCHRHGPDRIQR
jgi:hypothetical protein